jgi:hypothetical protein
MKSQFFAGLTTATALTGILATAGIANAAIFTTPPQNAVYQPTGNELNVPPPYNTQGFGRTTIANSPLIIQQFDPGLGTLLSVTIGFSGEMVGDGGFESLDAQPSTVTAAFLGNLQLNLPDNTSLFNLNPASGQLVFQNVSAFDGGLNFDGPSGETFQGLTAAASGANTYNAPNFLQQFIGNGNLNLLFSATGTSQFTGPSNLVQFINTYAKSSVTVQYEYEKPDQPPEKVPEPTAIAGIGLVAGLGLLTRGKKALNKA